MCLELRQSELKTTDNRTVYNHTLRNYLYSYGVCDYCKPHGGCNRRNSYGGFTDKPIKYPSWKLTTKNRKQWMDKSMKVVEQRIYLSARRYFDDYCHESVVRPHKTYVTFKW